MLFAFYLSRSIACYEKALTFTPSKQICQILSKIYTILIEVNIHQIQTLHYGEKREKFNKGNTAAILK